MTTVEARQLTIDIKNRTIVKGVSLTGLPGQLTALTGASGSGKSTLLSALGLLLVPASGQVLIDGVDTTGWTEKQRAQFWAQEAAFIYQDYGVLKDESVGANVALSAQDFNRNRQVIEGVLAEVGLAGRSAEPASVLSGGEKQRLGIARAIYKRASVIFADEPTASLDASNRSRVFRLLKEQADAGVTVLIATHDERLISSCDVVHSLSGEETEGALAGG